MAAGIKRMDIEMERMDFDMEPLELITVPREILFNIFEHLDFESIGKLARTCSYLHEITKDNALWYRIAKRNYNVIQPVAGQKWKRYCATRKLLSLPSNSITHLMNRFGDMQN
jgi:hypothetical protein